jgi:hypothetical protein
VLLITGESAAKHMKIYAVGNHKVPTNIVTSVPVVSRNRNRESELMFILMFYKEMKNKFART